MVDTVPDELYSLELGVKPPTHLRCGVPINPPVVVVVKEASMKVNGTGPRRSGDMSGVWVFVSLLSADGVEVLAPPRSDLVSGRTAASVHAPTPEQEENRSIIGYAYFPDLAIMANGQYRLRVSLIDMDSNGPAYREEGQAAVNMRSVTSELIHVDFNASTHRPTAEETELVTRLRRNGVLGA